MAFIVAIVVFLGVAFAATNLLLARWTAVEAAQSDIARRVGPQVARAPMVVRRRGDLLGDALGGPGDRLQQLLLQAGSDQTITEVVFRMVLYSTVALVGTTLLGLGRFSGVVGALAAVFPVWNLRRKARTRSVLIAQQLPDMMDLLVRALQSGHGFSDALHTGAMESEEPLRSVIRPVTEQQRLGLPMKQCLQQMVARLPGHLEISLFAGAVLLHQDTGGNLAESLGNLSETIRDRLLFDERVKSLTAEVRMSAMILSALPLLTVGVLLLMVPAYISALWMRPEGQKAAMVAGTFIFVGGLVMKRLAQVTS